MNINTMTTHMLAKINATMIQYTEGLICPRELSVGLVHELGEFIEAMSDCTCDLAKSICITNCTCQNIPQSTLIRYKFNLYFDADLGDFHCVNDEEVSRVLNDIWCNEHVAEGDIWSNIDHSSFYTSKDEHKHNHANWAIRNMLKTMLVTKQPVVYYNFESDLLITTEDPNRIDVSLDESRAFKIYVEEVEDDKRVFMCVWGEGYMYPVKIENQPFTFFTSENGYSVGDIKSISELEMGESYFMSISGNHSVVRIK